MQSQFYSFLSGLSDSNRSKLRAPVIGLIADHDGMFNHDEDSNHYYMTGFEVAEIISESVPMNVNDSTVDILDFASGFGRGTRFIQAFFPEANLHTKEVIPSAVEFCREAFNCTSSLSDIDYGLLDVTRRFDIIWVGSLATHLSISRTKSLLRFLSASLKDDGTLIISSHGSYVYGELKKGANYGIDTSRWGFFLSYLCQGYAYQNYSGEANYGISLISQGWWRRNAKKVGLSLRKYSEKRWDKHHDVGVFRKP